jgi:hypothetical protein
VIVVALLGMAPAVRATGIGSDAQRPLATVVVGGLASTLFLTFLALPALCYLLNRRPRNENSGAKDGMMDSDDGEHAPSWAEDAAQSSF